MFATWGSATYRLRRPILAVAVLFMVFAGVWGTGAFAKLAGGSLNDPRSESQRVGDLAITAFGNKQNVDIIALYSSPQLLVADPQFRDAVTAAEAKVSADPAVAQAVSYYDAPSAALVSADQHSTFMTIRLVDGTGDSAAKRVRHSVAAVGLTTGVSGARVVDLDIKGEVGDGIAFAEETSMPILTVLLVVAFGNLVAALMPVLIGGFAILGAFTAVRVVTMFTDVSVFAISIITILGLGLAVDYGLFIVSRFREELDQGRDVPDALSRTMATAGRTVAVSGVLVALALCGLLIFPQALLRSMGIGGAAAVFVAMVASLTVLPALLAVLGHRIDALRLPWTPRTRVVAALDMAGVPEAVDARDAAGVRGVRDTRDVPKAPETGPWARIAAGVMRRPVLYLVGVVVVLGVLAAPFAGVHFGGVDERMLPPGTQSRVVSETLASDFPQGGTNPVRVLILGAPAGAASAFERQIDAVPGVTGSSVIAQKGTATLVSADFAGDPSSAAAQRVVKSIRALSSPAGARVLVGGISAGIVDQLDSLGARLPWMALIVAGVTFLLLAVAFGSVLVPLKAIVMNIVSLGAAFGVVTWIFQEGHLSGLFNFTPTGYVEASQPILMAAILFGLSMDYEVFLLSRIRERWDETGDNSVAVASGVQRTGRIITTAAVLLCVVVGAFSTAGVTFVKMIGVGMFVALLVDATLVRLLLVPATMRLLGRANWWAPAFLTRLYSRYGVREEGPVRGPVGDPVSDPG